jgi:hypothetical protein
VRPFVKGKLSNSAFLRFDLSVVLIIASHDHITQGRITQAWCGRGPSGCTDLRVSANFPIRIDVKTGHFGESRAVKNDCIERPFGDQINLLSCERISLEFS